MVYNFLVIQPIFMQEIIFGSIFYQIDSMSALTRKLVNVSLLPSWKAKLLSDKLGIKTLNEFWTYYPYRYEDLSSITPIAKIKDSRISYLFKGKLTSFSFQQGRKKKVLKSFLQDETGRISLIWFNRIEQIAELWKPGTLYQIIGTPRRYQGKWVITVANCCLSMGW